MGAGTGPGEAVSRWTMQDPPYCRTCRRVLFIEGDTPVHTARSKNCRLLDVAPRSEIDSPIIDCDFCHDGAGRWQYEFEQPVDQQREITGSVTDLSDYQQQGPAARVRRFEHSGRNITTKWGDYWAACHTCAAFVEADDLSGLIFYICARLPTKFTRGNKLAQTRAELFRRFEMMMPTKRGRVAL